MKDKELTLQASKKNICAEIVVFNFAIAGLRSGRQKFVCEEFSLRRHRSGGLLLGGRRHSAKSKGDDRALSPNRHALSLNHDTLLS